VAADGWQVFLSTASINLYTNSNVVLLGLLASPTAVGHFVAAEKLIKAVKGLIDPVSQAFYPHISARSRQDKDKAAQSISKLALYLGAFFFMVSLTLVVGADALVTLLYGQGQATTASLLRLMAFIPFVLSLATCYATLYMLAFGYKQAWGRLIRSTIVVNFASLLVWGWFLPFEYAVALTLLVNETWVLGQSYLFWRKKWPMEAVPQ
jgi:O-antigen/teichoic acid export membrane protein